MPKMTLRELGEAIGYSGKSAEQRVWSWESQRVDVPSDDVPAIAKVLGVTICELYGVEEGHAPLKTNVDRVLSAIDELDQVPPDKIDSWRELIQAVTNAQTPIFLLGAGASIQNLHGSIEAIADRLADEVAKLPTSEQEFVKELAGSAARYRAKLREQEGLPAGPDSAK